MGQTVTLVEDIYTFASSSNPGEFASLGTIEIFKATKNFDVGTELFITDGTAAGTDTIRNINQKLNASSNPTGMTTFNNLVWFGAVDSVPAGLPNSTGIELYLTDGTYAGTTIFLDIFPGSGSSDPQEFGVLGTNLLFNADDGTNGNELWITDGTVVNTMMLLDINSGSDSNPAKFTLVGGELFFVADDGTNGEELWKTDGTAVGTVMVRNIDGAATSSSPHDLTEFGGELYFSASDANGRELWKSDGTFAGTTMVIDLNVAGDGLTNLLGDEPTIATHNGELFFGGGTLGLVEMELWKTDGTALGTSLAANINAAGTSLPGGLTDIGNRFGICSDHSKWERTMEITGNRSNNSNDNGSSSRSYWFISTAISL